jgi:adenylylsulfate kinase-like enzyme
VIWLTGLPHQASPLLLRSWNGSYSIATAMCVLDGDKVRHGLCSDLAFSPEDRKKTFGAWGNGEAYGRYRCDRDYRVYSPCRADRRMVRAIMTEDEFVEVYVNAPVEVCEQRDPKGLYAKARAEQIKDFSVSAPCEPPEKPEMELCTDHLTVEECAAQVMEYLDEMDRKMRSRT